MTSGGWLVLTAGREGAELLGGGQAGQGASGRGSSGDEALRVECPWRLPESEVAGVAGGKTGVLRHRDGQEHEGAEKLEGLCL